MRPALAILPVLTGCMTFSRVNGAKTLEPLQVELGIGIGARTSDDPVVPFPIPQGPVLFRIGLVEDLDLGLRGYGLGSAVDLRYRFYHRDRLHLAVNPGFGGGVSLNLINPVEIGGLEATLPLIAEWELGRVGSISAGPQVILRNRASLSVGSLVGRFDVIAGAGARGEVRAGLFAFGLAVDGVATPTRHTGVPSLVVGLDARIRTRSAEEAARRAARGKGKGRSEPP